MAAAACVPGVQWVNWLIVIAVFYLFLGAVLWLLGTVILRENPKNRVNRVTGLMLFFAGLGPLFAAIGTALAPSGGAPGPAQSPAYYNLFYLWELFFPQLLFFSFVFPVEHRWVARFRRAKFLIFAPHIFHLILVTFLARPDLGGLGIQTDSSLLQMLLAPVNFVLRLVAFLLSLLFEFHLKFFSLINLLYIAVAIASLQQGFKRITNQRLRNQGGFILGGILSAVGLYTVAFIGPALGLFSLPDPMRVGLAIMALLAGSAGIAWAIVRYQFLDVRLIVRQSLVFSASSAILVGVYLLLITQVAAFIKDVLEIQTPLVDVAFIVLVLLFFQPVKHRVDELIQRLFLRDKADPRAILESYSREIASLFDMDDLKKRMIGILTEQLFIERAFFATRDEETKGYILELKGLAVEPFRADETLFVEVRQRGRPVAFEEFVLDRPLTPVTEVLSRWGCRLVVPIIDRSELTAVLLLGEKISGYRYGVEDFHLLATLANQLAVALTNAELYREALEKQKMEEELNVARQIQLQLLPSVLPMGDTYRVAAFAHPSRQVGGDYYDFFDLPEGQLGIVIADVSGKGMGAALLVSQLQAFLKAGVRSRLPIPSVMANTNVLVHESTSAERFATLVYAELDPATCNLVYSNAGHNHPILVRRDGRCEMLDCGGLVLGVMPSVHYETGAVTLQMEDLLLFYTDGLSELQNPDGEEYGEARLIRFLKDNRHLDPEELKNRLVREVTRFALGDIGFDDLTMVVLKMCDGRGMTATSMG